MKKEVMSILTEEQQLAFDQLKVTNLLREKAQAVFLQFAALQELHSAQQAEAEAYEAAVDLAQTILVLDHGLRKKITVTA